MTFSWDDLEQIRGNQWTLPIPPTCARCGYILTGLPDHRCPECGTTFRWAEVRKRSARIWSTINQLRHANRDARAGLILGLICWGAVAAINLPRLIRLTPLARGKSELSVMVNQAVATIEWIALGVDIVALFASLFVILLGSQILNIRRVPPCFREHIPEPRPDLSLGIGTVACGLLLLVAGVVLPII